MEHSLLHGLQLCGLVFALGGLLFRWVVLAPALGIAGANSAGQGINALLDRWIFRAALGALLGTGIDFFVQVAEINGETIYAGVKLRDVLQYLTGTTVGNIAAVKALFLLVIVLLCRRLNVRLLVALALGAALASTLISHSAAVPQNRGMAVAAQVIHIMGAAVWLGMLAFVWLTTETLAREGSDCSKLLREVVARFSPYALASFLLISVSGVYSAVRFIESPRAFFLSAYGLTLLLKMLLLCFVAFAGFLNWRSIRPQLADTLSAEARATLVKKFLRLMELELSAGILLMLVAGILGAISPPSEPGASQLNLAQAEALLSPRFPSGHFVNPARFVGAVERSADDLRYAEFTHHWSGVFVILLGLFWLGQSISRPDRKFFVRSWPVLLIPFGAFISYMADPEVWILHTYTVREILSDTQVLEHQMGAVMVFVLAVLGLRDGGRPAELRPLGYALPILMIAGSLMLLGHAHSSLGISEDLTSLVNMEHAIIGSLGLMAGLTRWMQVRQLPGAPAFRLIWPGAIVMLGVFMAFFYRELTPMVSSLALR
jgi:putative copper resistance protein D